MKMIRMMAPLAILLMSPVAAMAGEVICESVDQQFVECEMDTAGEVRMVRQLSKTRCEEGSSYGFHKHSVWVDRGCRAVFATDPSHGRGNRQASGPSIDQIAACNEKKGQYDGEVVSQTALKPGAWELILSYDGVQYVCDVEASNRVTNFERLRNN